MAQKTAKELDLDLQATLDAAKRIEKKRDDARKAEAEKVAKAKAAADKRSRKAHNTRKAEFENIKIDYEDVVDTEPTYKKVSDSSPKPDPKPVQDPKFLEIKIPATQNQETKPAPKQEDQTTQKNGLIGWFNKKV